MPWPDFDHQHRTRDANGRRSLRPDGLGLEADDQEQLK